MNWAGAGTHILFFKAGHCFYLINVLIADSDEVDDGLFYSQTLANYLI